MEDWRIYSQSPKFYSFTTCQGPKIYSYPARGRRYSPQKGRLCTNKEGRNRLTNRITISVTVYAVPKYHKFICENFIQFWFSPMFVFSVHSWKRTLIFCENTKLNLIVDFGQVSTVQYTVRKVLADFVVFDWMTLLQS